MLLALICPIHAEHMLTLRGYPLALAHFGGISLLLCLIPHPGPGKEEETLLSGSPLAAPACGGCRHIGLVLWVVGLPFDCAVSFYRFSAPVCPCLPLSTCQKGPFLILLGGLTSSGGLTDFCAAACFRPSWHKLKSSSTLPYLLGASIGSLVGLLKSCVSPSVTSGR
jgi:hypothetical protein